MGRVYSEEEKQKLLEITYSEKSSRRVKSRVMAVNMHANGISNQIIAKTLRMSDKSVKKYIQKYEEKGLLELIQEKPYRPNSVLEDYTEIITESLKNEPCSTINECRERIKKITGIDRSPTQITNFIKKKGFRHLKTGQLPSKANPEVQKQFLEKELNPRLKEAKEGKRKVLFTDAAHFVMGAYLTCLWCITRIFVRTSSGRQRYNVLGAFDIFNQELITVTNNAYINSFSICELLLKIANKYSKLDIKITIVLDNAKYQRCKKVMEFANKYNIELLFLPTYSPNLNLIERLWKFVKKECLYAKHYDKFDDFKKSIDKCLNSIDKEHKQAISSLITPKFQLFKETKQKEDVAA